MKDSRDLPESAGSPFVSGRPYPAGPGKFDAWLPEGCQGNHRKHAAPPILAQALVYPATDARQEGASLSVYAEGFMQRAADVTYAFRTYALDHGATSTNWKLSPLVAPDHSGLPPALVITAVCDVIRDDGEAYARKLADAGVAVTCVRYLGMLHTFYGMRSEVDAAALAQRHVPHSAVVPKHQEAGDMAALKTTIPTLSSTDICLISEYRRNIA